MKVCFSVANELLLQEVGEQYQLEVSAKSEQYQQNLSHEREFRRTIRIYL